MNVLIIGATSAIATATARLYAARGDKLFLLARNESQLHTLSEDLKIRGANEVFISGFDALDFSGHDALVTDAFEKLGEIDIVLFAHGTLPDQKNCEDNFEIALREMNINATSVISLLTLMAPRFEQQGKGNLAVITSVAGDRGRQSNYLYGASKGMVSIFLQGLRNRLFKSGVNVVDIRPGFVDTPMTASFSKGALWAQPETIADGIVKGIDKGRSTLYLPWFWRFIMLIIKNIPEIIFKRLSL